MMGPSTCQLLLLVQLVVTVSFVLGNKKYWRSTLITGTESADPVYDVVVRVFSLKDRNFVKSRLDLGFVSLGSEENAYFELSDAEDGRVRIRATSLSELSYGVGWYFRTMYSTSFSWQRTGGHQLNCSFGVDAKPRPVGESVRMERSVPISYFNNVVTFSYSYVWYKFKDWEYLLDWMSLSGVNLAIAYTGQEEVWRKTFNSFNVSDEIFGNWTNGLAYQAWSRGQDLHGCAGGLPLKVMKHQWALQKRILRRMRQLGITPVLPTFQGDTPGIFRDLYPHANFSQHKIAWLDGTDPLFATIQQRFMEILVEDFGTNHWYETDGYFNHEDSPWAPRPPSHSTEGNKFCRYGVDPYNNTNIRQFPAPPPLQTTETKTDENAKAHSSAVYDSMKLVDPESIWLYQGWIWRGWGKEHLPYIRGFVSGVPKGKFVILDMFDEVYPEWNMFDDFAYFDTPFIWSTLQNFGGNTGMWGSLDLLNRQPFEAYKDASGSVIGTGGAPEGIDHNPIYYSLLLDINWRQDPYPSLKGYVSSWVKQRYGFTSDLIEKAWHLLLDSVYGPANDELAKKREWLSEKNADGLTALPFGSWMSTPGPIWYDTKSTEQAWKYLTEGSRLMSRELRGSLPRTLQYDLVNLGRECMAKLSNTAYATMLESGDGELLLMMMSDTDDLLCCESSFMTYPWLTMASELIKDIDATDKVLYQSIMMQARSQTTTWGPQVAGQDVPNSQNLDYANKQWGGQVKGFYAERIRCFVEHFKDKPGFQRCVAEFSYRWTNDIFYQEYDMCKEPSGSAVKVSELLISRYLSNDDQDDDLTTAIS